MTRLPEPLKDILALAGITYRQYYYWVHQGLLPGGTVNDDTYKILMTMGKLRDIGFSIELAAKVAQEAVKYPGQPVKLATGIRIIIEE